jgi:hypothetical protein
VQPQGEFVDLRTMDLALDPFDGGTESDPFYAAQVWAQAFGYTYDSLDHTSTQIRLLTLFPARDKSSPLMGQLCTANLLPTSPVYEALSYVWRDPYEISLISVLSTPEPLHIDGKVLRISWNLSRILSHIRHTRNPRTLWIDAICINQDNPSEKNHQVRQMYRIYSLAHRVLIWLGEKGLDEDNDPTGVLDVRLTKYYHSDEQIVASFSSRSWWRRIWCERSFTQYESCLTTSRTLQEGLAAPLNSVIICGDGEFRWQDLLNALNHYLRSDRETLARLVSYSFLAISQIQREQLAHALSQWR